MSIEYPRREEMTTAAGMICADGIVVGTDTKVTAGGIKWSDNKLLTTGKLGDRGLVCAVAGRLRHVKDAIAWMGLEKLAESLGENPSFDDFLAKQVEIALPQFARDYYGKYGEYPSIEMIIGSIDKDGTPRLIEAYRSGDYDYKDNFAAIGSGSIFGEILLRKLYYPEISIELAKRLIGYIVWEVQEIDNESGESMQIVSIGKDGQVHGVDMLDIEALKQLPLLVIKSYEALRKQIQSISLEEIKEEIGKLQEIVKKIAGS